MPGNHSFDKLDKDLKEIATALGIAGVGVQEEVGITSVDALPDPDDMASHPTQEEVGITIAKALPDPNDYASHPTHESHNPLDIPFGHEVKEKQMGVKDVPGPDEVDEGGMGSGRNPEGGNNMGGGQPGPLISFGETIMKQFVDAKVSCPCNKS